MDLLQNDDELLLMELERRDGIYSFIFHELDANKPQTDLQEQQNKRKQTIRTAEEGLKLNEDSSKRQTTVGATTSGVANSSLLYPTFCQSLKSPANGDAFVKSSTADLAKSWQPHFNFQFPMTCAYPSFQQFCSLRTFNVRRAKSPFSHIQAPLVRNRCHELKETKEYKNFMQGITKVADLRELFPLDPDVHAPFATKPGGGLAIKDSKF